MLTSSVSLGKVVPKIRPFVKNAQVFKKNECEPHVSVDLVI